MTKKQRALAIIQRLKEVYPLAECTLDYTRAWQLLVGVRLAAQCTDARVNVVTEELFAKYPSVAALAAATPEEIEAILKERKAAWKAPKGRYSEGVLKLFSEHAVSPMKGGYME